MCEIADCEVLSQGGSNVECKEEQVLSDDGPGCQDADAAFSAACGRGSAFLDAGPSDVDIEQDKKGAKPKNGRVESIIRAILGWYRSAEAVEEEMTVDL